MATDDFKDLPRSWKAARDQKSPFYFTGCPCKREHIAKRYAQNGSCVVCRAQYHQRNPERFRATQKRSYEKCKDKRSVYRKANAVKAAQYNKDYQVKNRRRLNEISNDWYWRHRELVAGRYKTTYRENAAQHNRNRKARRKRASGRHSAEDIRGILGAQKHKCAGCRLKLNGTYHVDHIKPLAKGGSNSRSNLQIMCPPCNLSKNARDPIEFMQSRGFLL